MVSVFFNKMQTHQEIEHLSSHQELLLVRQVREVKYNVEEVASLSEQETLVKKPLDFREFLMCDWMKSIISGWWGG